MSGTMPDISPEVKKMPFQMKARIDRARRWTLGAFLLELIGLQEASLVNDLNFQEHNLVFF
jgi:hypothetical protein